MFTRKARRILRKKRENARAGIGCEYVELLKAGEKAACAGLPLSANPYTGEDAEIWQEGYADWLKIQAKRE